MRKITAALLLTLALITAAHAANPKWKTLTFTEDKQAGFEALKGYCLVHEVTPNDVLWANHTDSEDVTAGTTIYLPGRQADLLAIWQNVGAWKPKALVPVTSGAAARRLIEDEKKAEPTPAQVQTAQAEQKPAQVQTAQAEQKPSLVQEAAPPLITANVFPNGAPVLPVQNEAKPEAAPTLELAQDAQPESLKTAPAQDIITAAPQPEPKPAPVQKVVKAEAKPEPEKADPIIIKAGKPAPKPKKAAKKTNQLSPAAVIAQTAKPDKILTAKPKPKSEIPGLMDPIIILSPNGDPTAGPMRLIISGDKVEVVKLPQTAAPKKPSVADINTPFTATGSGWSYLPHYNMTPKPNTNNLANLNSLNGKMMWPVDGKISSPFGKWRGKHKHEGIDIPMPAGTPIRAARNGVVSRTGNNSTMGFRGYGNFVMLDHGGSIKTFYAHCSSVAVVEGQRVMQGQIIGYVGSTGRSTANHLHFEVRVNDSKVNPVPYLAGNTQLASHK